MILRRCVPLLCSAPSVAAAAAAAAGGGGGGVAEPRVPNTLFSERRERILADLRENRNDKSLAGRVDPEVSQLVRMINENFSCYVTTSSCSGRASLFHKGQVSTAVEAARAERKRGSFGRGALFQTHDPLRDVQAAVRRLLTPALESFAAWRQQQQQVDDDPVVLETELLQLKFEPMIVHVMCATIDDAARLLQCASESGQMESGVLSCSRGTSEQRKITCCITSPLRVDIPLFAQGRWLLGGADFARSAEWQALLANTVTHMNALFDENEARRCRLVRELKGRLL